jgi:hypothetical protein
MNATDVLSEVSRLGITIWSKGERLLFRPKRAITPELAEALAANKPGVLAELTRRARVEDASNIATRDELAFWLHILRSDGASIGLKDGVPMIDWPAHLDTLGRRRDWAANLSVITEILADQAAPTAHRPPTPETGRRLIGCGFPPRHSEPPPETIIATPRVLCPNCGQRPVLAELRAITEGTCWPCWELHTGARSC